MASSEPLERDRRLCRGQDRAGGEQAVASDDHGAVVEGRPGRKERDQQVRGYVGVKHDARLGDLLQAGLPLHDDQGTVALVRQPLSCSGYLCRDMGRHRLLGRRYQPGQGAQAADSVEGAPQFRLEDNDKREQPHVGTGLEDDLEEAQVERHRRSVDEEQEAYADDQSNRARPPDQTEQPVDQESRDGDIGQDIRADLGERRLDQWHRGLSVYRGPEASAVWTIAGDLAA